MTKPKIMDEIEEVLQAILDGVAWVQGIVGDTTSMQMLMSKVGDEVRAGTHLNLYQILGYTTIIFELLAVSEDGDKFVPVLEVYFKLLENFVEFAHEKSRLARKVKPHATKAEGKEGTP